MLGDSQDIDNDGDPLETNPEEMCIISEEIVSEDEEEIQIQTDDIEPDDNDDDDDEELLVESIQQEIQMQPQSLSSIKNYSTISTNNNKRKLIQNDHSSLISKNILIETAFEDDEDEFDAFGKIVATKLRRSNKLQNVYAQKIISDTLYNAERTKLSSGSYVCVRPITFGLSSNTAQTTTIGNTILRLNNKKISPAAVAVVSSAPEKGMHTF